MPLDFQATYTGGRLVGREDEGVQVVKEGHDNHIRILAAVVKIDQPLIHVDLINRSDARRKGCSNVKHHRPAFLVAIRNRTFDDHAFCKLYHELQVSLVINALVKVPESYSCFPLPGDSRGCASSFQRLSPGTAQQDGERMHPKKSVRYFETILAFCLKRHA